MFQICRFVFLALFCCFSLSAMAFNTSERDFICDFYFGNTTGDGEFAFSSFTGANPISVRCTDTTEPTCPSGSVPVYLNCTLVAVDYKGNTGQDLINKTADYVLQSSDLRILQCSYFSNLNDLSDEITILGQISCLSE